MKSDLETRRVQVAEELKRLELRMEFLRGQLAAFDEIEGSPLNESSANSPSASAAKQLLSTPPISVGKAILQGMIALREFTKADVIKWVRSTHPLLKFSDRSWGRPLRDMMDKGEVVLLRKNAGNKTQAVYGLKKAAMG